MQSLFLPTAYANDSQQVIYMYDRTRVKVNTLSFVVKNLIHRDETATDEMVLRTQCITENPEGHSESVYMHVHCIFTILFMYTK